MGGMDANAAKLAEWCDYLDGGGLDRPIDAIPFGLMRCHDGDLADHEDDLAELVGILLAVAALEGTDKARAVAVAAGGGPGADIDAEMDEQSVAQWVVLVTLLSMWADGLAVPTEPQMTLRKAILTSDGPWRVPDPDEPEPDAGSEV